MAYFSCVTGRKVVSISDLNLRSQISVFISMGTTNPTQGWYSRDCGQRIACKSNWALRVCPGSLQVRWDYWCSLALGRDIFLRLSCWMTWHWYRWFWTRERAAIYKLGILKSCPSKVMLWLFGIGVHHWFMGEKLAEINCKVLIIALKFLCRPKGSTFFWFLDYI